MQVINHNKGNYTFVSPSDSSVMYGTVKVSQKEFKDILSYLKRVQKSTKNTYHRDGLSHLFEWVLPMKMTDNRVCLGVSNTELVFNHFHLPRYKRQNYVFVVE